MSTPARRVFLSTIHLASPLVCVALSVGSPRTSASELDLVLFGSLDAGASTFATSGAKLSQAGEGPAVLVSLGGGARVEPAATVTGYRVDLMRSVVTASAVFGYQWSLEAGALGFFAGPEATFTTVAVGEDVARRTAETGWRLQGEAWLRPSEATLVQATLIAGTTRASVWTRIAGGYRAWDGYLGPEIGLYADATGYQKWTLGVHATDFTLAGTHLRLSLGGQTVSNAARIVPYVGLASWTAW